MRIPFKITSVEENHEATGFLYIDDDFLVFEYQILKWGITKGASGTVKAERGVIDAVRVKRGLFKDQLLVATRNIQLLREIPGPHVSEIELRTKKKHRDQIDAFIQEVWAWKSSAPQRPAVGPTG
jgi:hypothetical protein